MAPLTRRSQVVIVGAGFGGLRAAKALAKTSLDVTVVDRHNFHLFQPLLYQVATAGLAPEDIAYPMRAILRGQQNASFKLADVTGVDFDRHILQTSQGDMGYDYLVLAVGGETNTFGIEGVAHHAFGLKSIDDAAAIRSHLLKMFELAVNEPDVEKRRALLTFVVVGGGPTGVECSGAISELIRLVLSKDYPRFNLGDVRIVMLEAASRLLPALPESLAAFTLKVLSQKKVDVHLGAAVADYDGRQVTLKDGSLIPARTLIWAAGIQAAGVVHHLGVPTGGLGRVKVKPTLQLQDHPEVFVIGDAAWLEDANGKSYPMVAPVAMQQAVCAAENIRRLAAARELIPFIYHDPGTMSTIGRNQAVAMVKGVQFRGFLAWLVWLVVHIMQLIGFRNRLVVLINWAWDYFFYDRAVRLIQQDCD
jgi:NADH:ubiquinone reductase (H+-translocating)